MKSDQTSKPGARQPVINCELARKVLDRDIVNIVKRVQNGQPLTPQQRILIACHSGVLDRTEVLEALSVVKQGACQRCARLIAQLIGNIKDEETDTGS